MEERIRQLTAPAIVAVAIAIVAISAFLGYTLSKQAEQALGEQIQDRMMEIARPAANLLDGDALESLTAEDVGTPPYEQAMDTLRAFQGSVDLSYIYCVRQTGAGEFEFTVDPTPDDPAEFGESVRYTEALGQAAAGTPSVDLVAYTDRWGRFYSAYCPVFDSQGSVASIVCVDFDASWYETTIAQINSIIIAICLALALLALIVSFASERFARENTRQFRKALHATRYDELTGLANMDYFFASVSDIWQGYVSQGKKAAVLYIDLINMNRFNQKYGYSEGDKLLRAFADLLAEEFGHERCSRFGQDHFVVITDADGLEQKLDLLVERGERLLGGMGVPLCVGVCVGPEGIADIQHACDRAKIACSANPEAYRSSRRYFEDEMLIDIRRRQYFIDNLDRAIEEGWIEVHYQPIVRAASGGVCDEEALARWRDPERGLLSPAEFIPALEEAELIYKLDLNVLEQVLVKMERLSNAGLYIVPASINLSRSDFETCDIVEEVRKRVDAAGVAHDMINVEITETAIGRDFEFMREQIERFRSLGFRVWMDDFGSEYSSLDYLQNLQFDLIKFDMQFMRQFDDGDKAKVILTELAKMAVGLHIDTIVEGVETERQVDFLREIGCSKLQGYYFTKPLPVEKVLERYEQGTAIGFENPAESEYYSTLGRVNLYDLASVAREDDEGLPQYFETLPMAIVEFTDDGFSLIRCNRTYRDALAFARGDVKIGERVSYEQIHGVDGGRFLESARNCSEGGEWLVIAEPLSSSQCVHAIARQLVVNPVSKTRAVVIAVLSLEETTG